MTVKSTPNSAFMRKDFVCVTVTFDSHPIGINGRNAIVAFPPLKFLPIKEFEKRQKSIDHDTRMIMSSMMTKFGVEILIIVDSKLMVFILSRSRS